MGKKEFAAAALDLEHETFVVHVALLSSVASPSSSPLKEFAAAALDPEHETYVVLVGSVSSVASPNSSPLDVHPTRRPQIAGLIAEEAPTKVPIEYADFAFSPDLASELPEHTGINDHAIKLVDANGFIRPSKSPAGAPKQAGKGLILPEDFLLADASMVFHLQQCRHTGCKEGACLDNLHGCGQLSTHALRSERTSSCGPRSLC